MLADTTSRYCGALTLLVIFIFCTGFLGIHKSKSAQDLALSNQMKSEIVQAGKFKLQTYVRLHSKTETLRIYIEGDGFAWARRNKPSRNPTPRNPVALSLASLDSHVNVAYIARPCQYVDLETENHCSVETWTSHRFSEDVVQSISEAINQLKAKVGVANLELVGFSGGGAIAVLVAAQRDDVKSIRTIAANLDHVTWTKKKKVTPLSGSLNAMDAAHQIAEIAQYHWTGAKDKIIEGVYAARFINQLGESHCATSAIIAEVSHIKGWYEAWPSLLRESENFFSRSCS